MRVRGRFTLERDNRKVATVALSVFSDEDQKYILEWNSARDFMSGSKFKIEAKRTEVDDKDESETGYVTSKRVENCGYKVLLNNNSTTKLEKLEMEYLFSMSRKKAVGKRRGSAMERWIFPTCAPNQSKV